MRLTPNGINVLSPFNGCSGALLALIESNIPVKTYISLETDKYANTVSQANWGNTVWQMGDVRGFSREMYRESYLDKNPFDLLIGGSPCQDVSFAGHQKGLIPGTRSSLFFEYVRLLKEFKPKYFLLENVRMKQSNMDIISDALGVQPIKINSSLFTAQNRVRYYWTNIPQTELPEDKGVVLQDILEPDGYFADRDKSFCIDANYFKGGNLKSYFEKHRRQLVFSPEGLAHVGDADLKGHGYNRRVYHRKGKSPSVCAASGGNLEPKVLVETKDKPMWRKLLPLEVERLQGMPPNYTNHVSNTQRFRMIGNGFTIPVISHLLGWRTLGGMD
tara:strand:- start:215 stop:1207 length:993 start_codon:yes stop_codon:yes gene_type:complete